MLCTACLAVTAVVLNRYGGITYQKMRSLSILAIQLLLGQVVCLISVSKVSTMHGAKIRSAGCCQNIICKVSFFPFRTTSLV